MTTSAFSKDFKLMAIGQIVSLFGNQILRFALPLYLLHQTGSAAIFGAISALAFVPMIVLFPIGGMIADRVNKRNIMVALDGCTALMVVAFLLTATAGNIVPLSAAVLFALYAIQGAYQPAVQASIPVLVKDTEMMTANAIVDMIGSLANMLGPVLGGLLYAAVGLLPILSVSAVCFFASAVMECFLHIPGERSCVRGGIIATGWQDSKESFVFLLQQRPLLLQMALCYGAVALLLCSLFNIALPVLITERLGFEPVLANRLYGYAQGAIAIGSVLGGFLAGTFGRRLQAHTISRNIVGSGLCMLCGGLALAFGGSAVLIYVVLALGCSVLMVLSTLFQVQMMAFVQMLTPQPLIGKVISCIICICMCANPIGQFVYGQIFEQITDGAWLPFVVAATLAIVVGIASRSVFMRVEQALQESGVSR